MDTIFKRWWLLLINGILFLILGFISLGNPFSALYTTAVYIGIAALFTGVGALFFAVSNMGRMGWGWRLFEGIIDIIFGILMLNNPILSAEMVPMLIGIWIFIRGAMFLTDAMAWRKKKVKDWNGYAVIGVLMLILGFMLMFDNTQSLLPVAFLLTATFLFLGFGSIFIAFGFRKAGRIAEHENKHENKHEKA